MIPLRILWWKIAYTLRDLGLGGIVVVLALIGFGTWSGYAIGHRFGVSHGVKIGKGAERTRQAEAGLKEMGTAIHDKEAGENEAADEWNRAGGDLERLCETDPACRDRHGLYLDEGAGLVGIGHAGDGAGGTGSEREAREALPEGGGVR